MLLTDFTHVQDRWDDAVADALDPVGRLVYRSNLLGSDWRITNTGGGNTSSKVTERDPITGEPVEVLWVKGSGGDLRTADRKNFSSLYMDRFGALKDVYARADVRGPKTPGSRHSRHLPPRPPGRRRLSRARHTPALRTRCSSRS